MNFSVIKQKETYIIHNTTLYPGYFSVVKKGCASEVPFVSGNIASNSNATLIPTEDGEYVVNIIINSVEEQFTISHYPLVIKAVVRDLEKSLCNSDCGCGDNTPDCLSKEGQACLSYQLLFGNIGMLMGIIKTINCDNTDVNILAKVANRAINVNKCDLLALFCEARIEVNITGSIKYKPLMFQKIVSIYYLCLYLYEKEITNKEKEYITYLDNKYNYRVLKACILKAEIDILLVENLFTEVYYDACGTPDTSCDLSCFQPTIASVDKLHDFLINQQLDGIYDTVILKNTCGTPQLFMNRTIYKDETFSLKAVAQSSVNPAEIQPGEELLVNIVFKGTKPSYSVLTIPFNYEGALVNTYKVRFLPPVEVSNTAPVITDIVKSINNRTPYQFTATDFEAHFTDVDGDYMDKIVLVGDTTRYTLDNLPYASGTPISRSNISGLKYTPLDTDNYYEVVVNWKAYDDKGLESN